MPHLPITEARDLTLTRGGCSGASRRTQPCRATTEKRSRRDFRQPPMTTLDPGRASGAQQSRSNTNIPTLQAQVADRGCQSAPGEQGSHSQSRSRRP